MTYSITIMIREEKNFNQIIMIKKKSELQNAQKEGDKEEKKGEKEEEEEKEEEKKTGR